MRRVNDRLRRLEQRFRDRGPSPEELSAAWGRVAERARAKLRGEGVDEGHRARDRDTVRRWERRRERTWRAMPSGRRRNLGT